jgi:hypothetical protein
MMHKVTYKRVLLSVACLSFALWPLPMASATGAGRQADSQFSKDGFLKIDGVPRLIIGLYELPQDDAKLTEIAENGFNLVRVPQDTAVLDKVGGQGLYAWICLGSAAQLNGDDAEGGQRLAGVINRFKTHPALLVWELPDEALWNIWWGRYAWIFGGQQKALRAHIDQARANTPEATLTQWRSLLSRAEDYDQRGLWKQAEELYGTLWAALKAENPHPAWKMSQCPAESNALIEATARGCDLLRQLDARRPIWQNHAPRNSTGSLRKYNRMVDAAGCDIYPVPFNYGVGHSDLKDMNLSTVGAYTDRMRNAAPGKSIWMVLQGFGWRDISEGQKDDPDQAKGRRPRFPETRFMAYDALVHGANAILYWGTHAIEKDSVLWQDLMKVAQELRALEPALVANRAGTDPVALADETYGSVDSQGPTLMLRGTGDDWVLIAVNEYAQAISFNVRQLPQALEGKTLYRLHSDETQIVRDGGFHDGIRGLGVHVYATSRSFEAK